MQHSRLIVITSCWCYAGFLPGKDGSARHQLNSVMSTTSDCKSWDTISSRDSVFTVLVLGPTQVLVFEGYWVALGTYGLGPIPGWWCLHIVMIMVLDMLCVWHLCIYVYVDSTGEKPENRSQFARVRRDAELKPDFFNIGG